MKFDTTFQDEIICPYCGSVEDDSYEYGESDDEYICSSCGKKSSLSVSIRKDYSTYTLED